MLDAMGCCCELQNTLDVEVSAGVPLQAKSVDITENGTTVVKADDGSYGLKSVEINTNVPKRFECGDATFAPPASGATSISIVGLLKTLNASCWDTSSVTTMCSMFRGLSSLKSLDASGWDTSKVTSMQSMFASCKSLQSIYVSKWDTSSVTNMLELFANCYKLQYIDVSNWNTSRVKSMDAIFAFCKSLQNIDVSKWDTSSCTSMEYLFRECKSLKSVDLNGFDVSNITSFFLFFGGCKSLRTIIGDKTLQDVENGTVALRGTKVNIQTIHSPLRFSSILALANGLADLTGSTAQTLDISVNSYNNMYNDDDTKPIADVIAERQARIAAICAAKNWNFAH